MDAPKIVAVDFDNTIAIPDEDFKGLKEVPLAIQTLKDLRDFGYFLILWTCRTGEMLDQALQFLSDRDVQIDTVNENYPELSFQTSRKIYYDILIDDRNFGVSGLVDWEIVRSRLLFEGDEVILWKGKYIQVISPRDNPYEAIAQKDCVSCILHDTVRDRFFVRQEFVPPYEYRTGRPYWYTALSGGVEEGESSIDALVREVAEEAGVDLKNSKNVNIKCLFSGPLNKTLANFGRFFLVQGEFARIKAKGDGTIYEDKAMTAEITREELFNMSHEHSDYILISSIALIQPFI